MNLFNKIVILSYGDYDVLNTIKEDYDKKCQSLRQANYRIDDHKKLIENLQIIMQGLNAVIFDIKQDKEDNVSFICVADQRSPDLTATGSSGDVNIFVLSKIICSTPIPRKINDMPHLCSHFCKGSTDVVIDELHTDISGSSYEGKGYASMMIDTLIKIAQKSGCTKISGKLSPIDASTDEKKIKRNGFYEHKGFRLTFKDVDHKEGNITLEL